MTIATRAQGLAGETGDTQVSLIFFINIAHHFKDMYLPDYLQSPFVSLFVHLNFKNPCCDKNV